MAGNTAGASDRVSRPGRIKHLRVFGRNGLGDGESLYRFTGYCSLITWQMLEEVVRAVEYVVYGREPQGTAYQLAPNCGEVGAFLKGGGIRQSKAKGCDASCEEVSDAARR